MRPTPLYLNESDANTFPASIAYNFQCVMVRKVRGVAIIAAGAPFSDDDHANLRFILDCEIKVLVKAPAVISATLDKYYPVPKEDRTSYQPGWHGFHDDGTLEVRSSRFEDSCFWAGAKTVAPDDPDYEFWCWLVRRPEYAEKMDASQIPAIKRVWRRYVKSQRP